MPASKPTKVVRVACIEHFVVDAVWKNKSKNFKGFGHGVDGYSAHSQGDVVDIFAPRKLECGSIFSVHVKVAAFFQRLGLIVKNVPHESAWLFYLFCWWFESISKYMSCFEALLAETIEHFSKKSNMC